MDEFVKQPEERRKFVLPMTGILLYSILITVSGGNSSCSKSNDNMRASKKKVPTDSDTNYVRTIKLTLSDVGVLDALIIFGRKTIIYNNKVEISWKQSESIR